MTFAVNIPVWLCWLLGIPLGVFLVIALLIGVVFIFNPPRVF